jgi:hypothetical protein
LFFLVGLAASFAVPVSVLTASNAEARQPAEQPPKKKKKKKKEEGSRPSRHSAHLVGNAEATVSAA